MSRLDGIRERLSKVPPIGYLVTALSTLRGGDECVELLTSDIDYLLSCIEGRGVERRFEAKLFDFADDERILFCADCLLEAMKHNLVIFSCALPVATTTPTAGGERCAECGHSEGVGVDGFCQHFEIKSRNGGSRCLCKCVFPAQQLCGAVVSTAVPGSYCTRLRNHTGGHSEGAYEKPASTSVPAEAAAQDETPIDLIAWKWANTLSEGEQSVLLSSSIKRLQRMIVEHCQPSTSTTSAAVEVVAREIVAWLNRTGCLIVGMMDDNAVQAQLNAIISKHFPTEAAVPAGEALKQKDSDH